MAYSLRSAGDKINAYEILLPASGGFAGRLVRAGALGSGDYSPDISAGITNRPARKEYEA